MSLKDTFEAVVKSVKETIGSEESSGSSEFEKEYGGTEMGEFRREFNADLSATLADRERNQGMRPLMEVWPYDDDDAKWVAFHSDKTRHLICNTPEYKDSPFCSSGAH